MNEKTITDVEGVFASACACGIKAGRNDLAFIYVPQACASAAVFTRNRFRAACVDYTAECCQMGTFKAAVVNAGNANAGTGAQGLVNARRTAEKAAELLGLEAPQVAVASTGIIGRQLPIDKIEAGLELLLTSPEKKEGALAARAILTTDTRAKQVFLERTIEGQKITVAGMCKGSGMIAPNMATMLGFIVTDAALDSAVFQRLLCAAVDVSFNMISVDTDTSTNDMVLALASGRKPLSADAEEELGSLLTEAAIALAKMIAADGEGATKLIEMVVEGAASREEAKKLALNVVNSPLVKAAVHGADPNWGRILMALGKDPGLEVYPERIDLYLGGQQILSKGEALDYNVQLVRGELREPEVRILARLHAGDGSAAAWGCDLSKEYVEINTAYN